MAAQADPGTETGVEKNVCIGACVCLLGIVGKGEAGVGWEVN